jgi:hypothetical protein
MNDSLNVTSFLNCSKLNEHESNMFEWFIKCIKITGILLQIIFFIFIFNNKYFKFRQSVFLLNLSIINFLSLISGLFSFNIPLLCESQGFCTFQGLFGHLCIALHSFGIIVLAKSRLMCVLKPNLVITKRKILILLTIAWCFPITNLIFLKIFLNANLEFNDATFDCMLVFSNKTIYMWVLIVINCIFPGISMSTLFYLIYRFKQKKNRVEVYYLESTSKTPFDSKKNKSKRVKSKSYFIKELKLLILLTIIYISFEIHVFVNMIKITKLESDTNSSLLMTLRSLTWITLLLNPILYFIFYLLMIKKLKKSIRFK